ncbi:hypothetical protein HK101_010561, partial [Irineochytrium annulatum]
MSPSSSSSGSTLTDSTTPAAAPLAGEMAKLALDGSAPAAQPESPGEELSLAMLAESVAAKSVESICENPWAGQEVGAGLGHDYLQMILTANVYDVAIETPLQRAHNLSTRLNSTLLLKREDLQPVFSFKLRGAYNRMRQLTPEERGRGVIACSAGNHAQGVALAAKRIGIRAMIVMPEGTPPIKWRNVRRLGAEVVLFGRDFDDAKKECARLAEERGFVNIPPFDDPYVIAGQGTVGVEILRQAASQLHSPSPLPIPPSTPSPDPDGPRMIDAIFVAVGGGGLAAGIASYVKRICPRVKVIGVETYDANAMWRSLKEGKRVVLDEVGLFADGAAVKVVGEETFRICRDLLDGMVLVSTDELCAAIKDTFEDTRSVIEPAGALAVAGAKKYIQQSPHARAGGTYVSVVSGANMQFDRLRFVADRADFGEDKEVLMTVTIPERPGAFMELYGCIHPRSVTEFSYRFGDPRRAAVFISFRVEDREQEVREIVEALEKKGMRALDASGN